MGACEEALIHGLRCRDFADLCHAGCDPAALLQGGAARELLGVEETSPEARHEGWLMLVVDGCGMFSMLWSGQLGLAVF